MERVFDGVRCEVAAADELSEAEGGSVQGVVAVAGWAGPDTIDFGVEGRLGPWCSWGVEATSFRRGRASFRLCASVEEPVGHGLEGSRSCPAVAASSDVEARRGDDVAAVGADVDAGAQSAGAVPDGA